MLVGWQVDDCKLVMCACETSYYRTPSQQTPTVTRVLRKRRHLTTYKQSIFLLRFYLASDVRRTTGQAEVALAVECHLRKVFLNRCPCWRAHYFSACGHRPLFLAMLFILLQRPPMPQSPICTDKLP